MGFQTPPETRVRIDKWLWAARFFKHRGLATAAVDGGRVQINGQRCKPSHGVKPGDRVELSEAGAPPRVFEVLRLSEQRGPASVAQTLYRESAESIAARQAAADQKRLAAEPAQARHGRPTKRERRSLERWRGE